MGQGGARSEALVLGFLPAFFSMPVGMYGGICGDLKGSSTGQLIHTMPFPGCHLWDGENSKSACGTMLSFMLRNKPVPPGWGPAAAPFCLQQEGSDATVRALGREVVTRATLNRVFHFKTEGKRFLLLLGQSRTLEGASKIQGGWRGSVRDCKEAGSGAIAGTCQRTGRNGGGAPQSDVCLGHSCNMEGPK